MSNVFGASFLPVFLDGIFEQTEEDEDEDEDEEKEEERAKERELLSFPHRL